ILYTYVGYPLALWVWRRAARPRPPSAEPRTPSVSILVTVRNEEAHIARKLEDLLALDYPADRMEVLVVSDASTDATHAIVRARLQAGSHRRLRLFVYPERLGKTEAINRTVPFATGDILVLMDARQRVDPAALRALVANFADPEVGMVGGELVLV